MKRTYIRQARSTDLDDLVKLLQLLFAIEEDFEPDTRRQQCGLEMLLDSQTALIMVAEAENKVIGMCTGQLLISTAEGGLSLLIEDVIVDEHWRGQGVGKQLLNGLEEWACEKKVSRFQLLADRSNQAGLEFYDKLHWQSTQLFCLRKKPVTHNENEG